MSNSHQIQERRRRRAPSGMGSRTGRLAGRLAAILLLAIAAGCRTSDEDGPFVPSPAVAAGAVGKALDAWVAGRPASVGPEGKPPEIGLVDSDRIGGRTLRGYEILGPIDLGIGRGFTVRLDLEPTGPDDSPETVVRYVVFGQGPVWVFRLEDYERIAHWEHKMDPDEEGEPAPAEPATGHAGTPGHAPGPSPERPPPQAPPT
jgi:hypothetical protein